MGKQLSIEQQAPGTALGSSCSVSKTVSPACPTEQQAGAERPKATRLLMAAFELRVPPRSQAKAPGRQPGGVLQVLVEVQGSGMGSGIGSTCG